MRKMIDIRGLEYRYKRQTKLLSGINLQIYSGRINGLLGKNGEGKSTLLKLVSGLLFPIEGKINVLGNEPRLRNPKLLQDLYFLPEELPDTKLSVEAFERVYAPFYPNFSSSTFYKYLSEFTIEIKTSNINELSYGQKKKFMIAFGMATCAKVILMDEPTNGLDIPSKRQFRRMVASATNDNCCIVISTHQVLDLENLIDNIIIMDEHQIVFNETVDNVTKKLLFRATDSFEKNDEIIYSEDSLSGYNQVLANKNSEESKLDIELLFNAVTFDKNKIKKILKTD